MKQIFGCLSVFVIVGLQDGQQNMQNILKVLVGIIKLKQLFLFLRLFQM